MTAQGVATQASDREGGLSPAELRQQNHRFAHTGGVSQTSGQRGFLPAFLDQATGISYLARFPDGRPAPMHLLDGLPEELIQQRSHSGRVHSLKTSVVAGFLRRGRFFTREQAARALRLAERIHSLRQPAQQQSA